MGLFSKRISALGLAGLLLAGPGVASRPETVLMVWDSTQSRGAGAFKSLVELLKRQRAQGHFVGLQINPSFRIYDLAVPEHARSWKQLGMGRPSQPLLCLTLTDSRGLPQKITWRCPVQTAEQAMSALDGQLGLGNLTTPGLATPTPSPTPTATPAPSPSLAPSPVPGASPSPSPSISPSPEAPKNLLTSGQSLMPQAFLESPNGVFRLLVREDGNWGVYRRVGERLESNWETGTGDKNSLVRLERTGLLRVLNGDQRSLWHSSYEGIIAAYRLVLQDDGDLVVEQQRGSEWFFCWSSLRGSEGHYRPSPGIRLDRERGPH